MNREIQRKMLFITLMVLGAIVLSFFFWPEWTDWKVRLGVLIVAISLSMMYRERPLLKPRPRRIKQEDPYELERQRLKNWADSWR
jgi:uncharacterized membrane protein